MADAPVMLITGSSRGLGRALAEHYLGRGWTVVGASRGEGSIEHDGYSHHSLDVGDEASVLELFAVEGESREAAAVKTEP